MGRPGKRAAAGAAVAPPGAKAAKRPRGVIGADGPAVHNHADADTPMPSTPAQKAARRAKRKVCFRGMQQQIFCRALGGGHGWSWS
jgi:hypothetical protein